MIRALAKGIGLAVLGHAPGGAAAYRTATREWMGTQATHVDKLARVWPGYIGVWETLGGVRLEGARVWIHEAGFTAFPSLVSYLLTGHGATVTNVEGRILDRYLARSVNGALQCLAPSRVDPSRRNHIEALRWVSDARHALQAIESEVHLDTDVEALPLESNSQDLCHSGGALEHYPRGVLATFLTESLRVLRPGGIASHVFDHRDHLHHADAGWPFLAHLALPEALYRPLCGHPLGYHSRLAPAEVASMFREAGFERIAVRRMVLPEKRYVSDEAAGRAQPGLQRRWLAAQHRGITDLDLRTAAAHYLYRKPG